MGKFIYKEPKNPKVPSRVLGKWGEKVARGSSLHQSVRNINRRSDSLRPVPGMSHNFGTILALSSKLNKKLLAAACNADINGGRIVRISSNDPVEERVYTKRQMWTNRLIVLDGKRGVDEPVKLTCGDIKPSSLRKLERIVKRMDGTNLIASAKGILEFLKRETGDSFSFSIEDEAIIDIPHVTPKNADLSRLGNVIKEGGIIGDGFSVFPSGKVCKTEFLFHAQSDSYGGPLSLHDMFRMIDLHSAGAKTIVYARSIPLTNGDHLFLWTPFFHDEKFLPVYQRNLWNRIMYLEDGFREGTTQGAEILKGECPCWEAYELVSKLVQTNGQASDLGMEECLRKMEDGLKFNSRSRFIRGWLQAIDLIEKKEFWKGDWCNAPWKTSGVIVTENYRGQV